MKTTITLAFCLFVSLASFGQSDSYVKKLNKYFELNGTEETFETVVEQMMEQMKSTRTDVPAEIWDEFSQEMQKTSLKDLTKMLAPVYYKHLTEADLDKLNAFYQSDVGKKLAEKTPIITQESMAIGQQWGLQIAEKVIKELEKKGY
ncbi:DUF2059 domain-containing protein [bacterium SCSIO 12741]|nr:DUF2059 domain-containing protein [bacterium SCSIO 12741]